MIQRAASVVAVVLLSGCAATGATWTEHLSSSAAVSASSARLVVFRTKDSSQYSARAAALKLNDDALGSIEYGGFSVFDVAPGKHALAVDLWDSPGSCRLPIDVVAGSRYFFQVEPRASNLASGLMGGLIGMAIESAVAAECGGAFSIEPVAQDAATARLAELRLTEAAILSSGAPAAAASPAAVAARPATALPAKALEARLKELKRLREADLITEDVYQDQQRRALGLR